LTGPQVLDWLRRDPARPPELAVGDTRLPVTIRRLANARRMTLRLAPDGSEVRLSIPRWGTAAEALAFAGSRAGWLAEQLAKIPRAAAPEPGMTIALGDLALTLDHQPRAPRRPKIEGERLVVGGPAEGLGKRLQRWLEGEARALFASDLAEYCQRAARPLPSLALSRAQRRWGSCAHSGTIRLNWRLVMAPAAVRRAVVAHEVTHLVHFDHSPAFHALLGELFEGDIAASNRWLKRHGRELYAPFG
jgi:predicted metal-dependent hydrolase